MWQFLTYRYRKALKTAERDALTAPTAWTPLLPQPQAAATPRAPPLVTSPLRSFDAIEDPERPSTAALLVLRPILLALALVPPRELLARWPLISSQPHSISSGFQLAITLCRCFSSDPKAWPT